MDKERIADSDPLRPNRCEYTFPLELHKSSISFASSRLEWMFESPSELSLGEAYIYNTLTLKATLS
jgi:hypothetical protein